MKLAVGLILHFFPVAYTSRFLSSRKAQLFQGAGAGTGLPYTATRLSVLATRYLCSLCRYSGSGTGPLKLWMKMAAEL